MGQRTTRGNISVIFALTVSILLGTLAFTVDVGHLLNVRSELQNAVDAAALAAVRDLNGNADQYLTARQSAQYFASRHTANGTDVSVDLNLANSADGDVVLGTWDFDSRVFTVASATTPPYMVNAVQVTARRDAADGNAVTHYFAPLLGRASSDTTATAIAVGGSPQATCGFPLAVSDCSILDSGGNIRCNSTLTFNDATSDNVGFTLLSTENPNTPDIKCMIAKATSQCIAGCDCSSACNATSVSDGQIKISNGNNLTNPIVTLINNAVTQAAGGVVARVPVIRSGMTPATCGAFQYNQLQTIVGYVTLKITGATPSPNRSITAEVTCSESEEEPPAGYYFGFAASDIYLVR